MKGTELMARRHCAEIITTIGDLGAARTCDIMHASESGTRARYEALRELVRLGVVTRRDAIPYRNIHNTKMHELTESGRRIYDAMQVFDSAVGEVE